MNNRNVERATVDSSSSSPFPIFDVVICAMALALLVLLLAVNGCNGGSPLPMPFK